MQSGDLRLLWDFFFRRQALKNGVWRFEIALELFFQIFLGGKPWKRESGNLRLL